MASSVFIDTWGWLALGHRRESRHLEVVKLYNQLRQGNESIVTSDYVLDELISLIFRRESFAEARQFVEGIYAAADQGYLTIERITSKRFADAWILRLRFSDKPLISFTDLTSMAIMQELGLTNVVSEDQHFAQVGLGFQLLP